MGNHVGSTSRMKDSGTCATTATDLDTLKISATPDKIGKEPLEACYGLWMRASSK